MSRVAHPAGPRHGDVLPADHPPAAPEDLNALPAGIWPRGARRSGGVLTLGGIDVRDLAAEFGTPLYVCDEDDVRSRCREYLEAFGPDGRAVDAGIGHIVVDSFEEIARLAYLTEHAEARPNVLVRVTTGVEAHTHEFMATAHDDQKFGFSLAAGAADEAVRRVIACPGVAFAGLHSHIGSQIFAPAGFEVAAHREVGLAVRIRDEHGVEIAELDLGGGFGIAYTEEDDAPEVKELAQSLRDIVDGQCRAAGLSRPRLTVEPGRGWPRGARRIGGVLTLGGVDVRDLAAEFGTPLYVCDEADVRSRCREYLEAFGPDGRVFYAAKAFCSRAVLRWVSEEGLGVDVCTGGELEVALSAGVPPEQITMHGNNKTQDELARAVEVGVGHIVADSFEEIARLAYLTEDAPARPNILVRVTTGVEAHTHEFMATALPISQDVPGQGEAAQVVRDVAATLEFRGRETTVGETLLQLDQFVVRQAVVQPRGVPGDAPVRPKILVRVTTGVEAHTHEFMATAHDDQKFGFSLASGAADEAVRRVIACPGLSFAGLHSHIGSQIFDTAGFEVAAHRVVGLAVRIRDEHGIEIAELDLGGGFGIAYTDEDDAPEVKDLAESLREIVDGQCRAAGLSRPRLTVEPGRGIVGPSTVSLYTVGTIKDVDGLRTYVSVDGGMSDNIRTALYDASYLCALASRASHAPPMLSRVVGRHCESGDIVVRHAWLPADLAPGDLLAVPATGAYCRSLASNYNHVPRPAVVAVSAGGNGGAGAARPIVRRETLDDLLSLDCG